VNRAAQIKTARMSKPPGTGGMRGRRPDYEESRRNLELVFGQLEAREK